jgi:hypothetical protein
MVNCRVFFAVRNEFLNRLLFIRAPASNGRPHFRVSIPKLAEVFRCFSQSGTGIVFEIDRDHFTIPFGGT